MRMRTWVVFSVYGLDCPISMGRLEGDYLSGSNSKKPHRLAGPSYHLISYHRTTCHAATSSYCAPLPTHATDSRK